MNRFVIRRGSYIALPLSVLGLCLFADCTPLKNSYILAAALAEVAAILRDPGTQWIVFVCTGVYLLAFVVLRRRLAEGGRTGRGWNVSLPGELGLGGLMALAALAYALDYSEAAQSTHALTLLGAAMIGQWARLWESRKPKAESRNVGGETVLALIILLAAAAVWHTEPGHLFQYRGQARWSRPWDNPNTFGILMGVGVALAVGRLVQSAWNAEGRMKNAEWRGWAKRVFLVLAVGVAGVGLVKSYSRGAWVGTALGFACLLLNAEGRIENDEKGMGKAEVRMTVRRWVALVVICASVLVLGFWSFGHTERAVARRAYSVAHANDFSWRNRVAAWEGGLQMMAEKPWFGFGWNQPEPIYSAFYRAAKVDEGMAFQLNDYFMLGATLGLPALLCFAVYIALALSGRRKTGLPAPPTLGFRLWTLDSAAVCRAGAAVLLVGFWFDGGLFKLATGATFWILLELGRSGDHEIHEAHENG